MRASNPAGAVVNSDDPGPVSEVIMARVIGAPDVAAPAVAPSPPTTSMTPARRNDANVNRAMQRETPAIVAPLRFRLCDIMLTRDGVDVRSPSCNLE